MQLPEHLKIKTTIIATTAEEDRRYRVGVMLQRTGRPKYFTFHCFNCQKPVCELNNVDITAINDTMDMNNLLNSGSGIRCDGRFAGGRCAIWYYFFLN